MLASRRQGATVKLHSSSITHLGQDRFLFPHEQSSTDGTSLSRPFSSRSFHSREPLHRRNGKIRAREVRVIDDLKQQLGVMSLGEALQIARAKGLDLIEVAANATP